MKKQVVLLALLAVTLSACSTTAPDKKQKAKAAPIEELAAGPNTPAPGTETTPKPEMAGTTAAPGTGGYLEGDGPGADAPANIDDIPDAVPKAEPLHRYANREYTAQGKTYTPLTETGKYKAVGIASWYGKKFHGQKTSIGDTYDMYGMTAAHTTLPIPSYARVTNTANKKSVIVRVNDRGPFLHDRIIDLSYTAAHKLGIIGAGSAEVEVESIHVDDDAVAVAPAAPAPVTAAPIAVAPMPEPPAPAPVVEKPAPLFGSIYLQLGAFKSPEGAKSFMESMSNKLGANEKPVSMTQKGELARVNIGPYKTVREARAASEKLKAKLGFKPFISNH